MKLDYVCFNITSLCNMACPYCYRVGNSLGSIHLSTAKKDIDLLQKYGCRTINITGGEPLLNKHWKEIVKYCREQGIVPNFTSSGLGFTEEIVSGNEITSVESDRMKSYLKITPVIPENASEKVKSTVTRLIDAILVRSNLIATITKDGAICLKLS